MPEIIGTFLRTEQWDERANCSIEAWDSSRRNLAQECLEFAVRHFDWIEIGRVFRQVAKGRSCFFDRLPNAGPQMDPAVVHHNYIIALERGNQALHDISEEHLAGHGSLEYHRCGHFIVAQGGHKGDCLPCSERNAADHSLATWRPPVEPHQVRADRRLVDKQQPGGIKHALLSHPTSARLRDICSLSLGRLQAFF